MTLKMGQVKWFDQMSGFGFIVPVDGSNEVYVNRRAIANSGTKSLVAGQRVEFSLHQGSRGPEAADVIGF